MRHRLMASLLFSAFLSLTAWGVEKPVKCVLDGKSIVSHSASGIPQFSNVGSIEIRCSVPARPFPSKPGESRLSLKLRVVSYKMSPNGSRETVATKVKVFGSGSDDQQEFVDFLVHIPLEPAELDTETRRYWAKIEKDLAKMEKDLPKDVTPFPEKLDAHALEILHELNYQQRVGHFFVECHVVDGDQVLGVDTLELEVLFKGRFSDLGLRGGSPA